MYKAGKGDKMKGMSGISLQTGIDEGLLYFVPEPKSPHGVDVMPDGKYMVETGKHVPQVRIKRVAKEQKAMAQKRKTKDQYGNKRLKLDRVVFEDLFRVAFRALINNTVYSLEKSFKRNRKLSIPTAIRSNFLTERIQHAVATGAWIGNRQGVSQHLDRMNYLSALSHRRRVRSLLSTTQPHFEARDLHATHWGRLCPSETPEGSNIGLVKNLALTAKISSVSDSKNIEKELERLEINLEKNNES